MIFLKLEGYVKYIHAIHVCVKSIHTTAHREDVIE